MFCSQYKIKWKDYDDSYITWEPLSCLDNCPEKLAEFEREWRKKAKHEARLANKVRGEGSVRLDSDDDDSQSDARHRRRSKTTVQDDEYTPKASSNKRSASTINSQRSNKARTRNGSDASSTSSKRNAKAIDKLKTTKVELAMDDNDDPFARDMTPSSKSRSLLDKNAKSPGAKLFSKTASKISDTLASSKPLPTSQSKHTVDTKKDDDAHKYKAVERPALCHTIEDLRRYGPDVAEVIGIRSNGTKAIEDLVCLVQVAGCQHPVLCRYMVIRQYHPEPLISLFEKLTLRQRV